MQNFDFIIVVEGPAATGKTTLVSDLLEVLDQKLIVKTHVNWDPPKKWRANVVPMKSPERSFKPSGSNPSMQAYEYVANIYQEYTKCLNYVLEDHFNILIMDGGFISTAVHQSHDESFDRMMVKMCETTPYVVISTAVDTSSILFRQLERYTGRRPSNLKDILFEVLKEHGGASSRWSDINNDFIEKMRHCTKFDYNLNILNILFDCFKASGDESIKNALEPIEAMIRYESTQFVPEMLREFELYLCSQ